MKLFRHPISMPNRNTVAMALFFGLCAFAIVKSNAMLLIGTTGTYTDPREVFTILGSALTGPIGGLIIGFFAGIGIPEGKWLASVLAHQIACLMIGFGYKKFLFPHGNPWLFFLKWTLMVLGYYLVLLAPAFVIFNTILYNETISYLSIISGIHYEILFSIIFPLIALLILPERYKQPVW